MRKKILIIEDNAAQSAIIDFFFENRGYESIVCDNAETGIYELNRNKDEISLITLDINLPGMSGLHMLPLIKQDVNLRDIPVIMISALGQEYNISKALELGASDYFVKPVSLDNLEKIIDKYLK